MPTSLNPKILAVFKLFKDEFGEQLTGRESGEFSRMGRVIHCHLVVEKVMLRTLKACVPDLAWEQLIKGQSPPVKNFESKVRMLESLSDKSASPKLLAGIRELKGLSVV